MKLLNKKTCKILTFDELPKEEQKEFIDLFCDDEPYAKESRYFKYLNTYYSFDSVMKCDLKEYDGYMTLTNCSCLLVKFLDNEDEYVEVSTCVM